MPVRTSKATAGELFIVDNSDAEWKAVRYLEQWCKYATQMDIATGFFEIGSLLALEDHWRQVDGFRILMGDEVSLRTKRAFAESFGLIQGRLDGSIEEEKKKNVFLTGVAAIVDAIRSGKIDCRVYRKDKFHAKAYITHARDEVLGSAALVGSSNFTHPGLCENIELNVRLDGTDVAVLQEWFEDHWKDGEDVAAEILRIIARHTEPRSPFEIYAQSLHHLFRDAPTPAKDWDEKPVAEGGSRVYKTLDTYQKDGYRNLIAIADQFNGAFLCDGVGLGKTFIGMMLLERLVMYERRNVVLIVPKAARKAVWEASLRMYCPELLDGAFSKLQIINHTDITRKESKDVDWPALMQTIREKAEAIVIDEAHHFRNPGVQVEVDSENPNLIRARDGREPSRYRRLYHMLDSGPCGPKQVFLLTATPVNNHINDLRHMIELFSRKKEDHFAALGIQSLRGHFTKLENEIRELEEGQDAIFTDADEAGEVLESDRLFTKIVVQRSRSFVKDSQKAQRGDSAQFPIRDDPQVAHYNVRKTYGELLDAVDKAFHKKDPLFRLAIYNPSAYEISPEDTKETAIEANRQTQVIGLIRTNFLKRFESSAKSFEASCERLLLKMLAWLSVHCESPHEKDRLDKWKHKFEKILGIVHEHQPFAERHQQGLFDDEADAEEDLIPEELKLEIVRLSRDEHRVEDMIDNTIDDLNELADFLKSLQKLAPKHDDKLQKLISMVKSDKDLKGRKVLIFSEFSDTAKHIGKGLKDAGIDGVHVIDGGTSPEARLGIIERFAPFYNGSSSSKLAEAGEEELRVLISTDVLSEGLNLQDATRLINYDLHWNPVRLMQRIGRVDRRMNAGIEEAIIKAHPNFATDRGRVVYWNFLPPDYLENLLGLYSRVSRKTLRISKVFGIEGSQLLTPDDDYEALRDINAKYDGRKSRLEELRLEYQRILGADDALEDRLDRFPSQIYSGRQFDPSHTLSGRGVFFCYAMPGFDKASPEEVELRERWTEEKGETIWLLYNCEDNEILSEPTEIAAFIRSEPDTARHVEISTTDFDTARKAVEKHLHRGYLRSRDAPAGVRGRLVAWMDLSH